MYVLRLCIANGFCLGVALDSDQTGRRDIGHCSLTLHCTALSHCQHTLASFERSYIQLDIQSNIRLISDWKIDLIAELKQMWMTRPLEAKLDYCMKELQQDTYQCKY